MLLLNGCSKDEENNNGGEKLKSVTLTFDKLVLDNATVDGSRLAGRRSKRKKKQALQLKVLAPVMQIFYPSLGKHPTTN